MQTNTNATQIDDFVADGDVSVCEHVNERDPQMSGAVNERANAHMRTMKEKYDEEEDEELKWESTKKHSNSTHETSHFVFDLRSRFYFFAFHSFNRSHKTDRCSFQLADVCLALYDHWSLNVLQRQNNRNDSLISLVFFVRSFVFFLLLSHSRLQMLAYIHDCSRHRARSMAQMPTAKTAFFPSSSFTLHIRHSSSLFLFVLLFLDSGATMIDRKETNSRVYSTDHLKFSFSFIFECVECANQTTAWNAQSEIPQRFNITISFSFSQFSSSSTFSSSPMSSRLLFRFILCECAVCSITNKQTTSQHRDYSEAILFILEWSSHDFHRSHIHKTEYEWSWMKEKMKTKWASKTAKLFVFVSVVVVVDANS